MLSFYGLAGRASSGISSGFVEFTTVGTNQSITTAMIPAGVTRVRVHLIGGGGGNANYGGVNGGNSAFSAAGVSVMAGGGGQGNDNSSGGVGGSIAAVSGVIGAASGGTTGITQGGGQGGIGIDVGIAMGGGGGGYGEYYTCSCFGGGYSTGGGGQVGLLGPSTDTFIDYPGGAGGGYNTGQTLPIYGDKGGAGVSGINGNYGQKAGGGGGAYAMFYAPIQGATNYTNAITIGNSGGVGAGSGYCRIQWGSGI